MIEVLIKQNILPAWLSWQFIEVPRSILRGWKNILVFNLDYFSVPLLSKTLFSYWRAYRWYYPRGFDPAKYLEVFFSNLISRVLGAIVRLVLILAGLAAELLLFVIGPLVLLAWFLIPVLVIFGLWQGLELLTFFSVFAVLWQASLFFDFRLKARRLRISLEAALKQPENFNLTEFLDFEAGQAFTKALKFSASPNSGHLFYSLLAEKSRLVFFVFNRLLLDGSAIEKTLQENLKNLPGNSDLGTLFLEAGQNARRRNNELISRGDLLVSLSKNDPSFRSLLVETDLKADDVANLTWWWESNENRIRENKKFWEQKNLVKLGSMGKQWAAGYTITLDQFSSDLSELIRKRGFEEIVGHEKEVEQIERVLARAEVNNALVVGEAGSGRGAIIQALTQKIICGESLNEINHLRVVELNLPLLVNRCKGQEEVGQALEIIFRESLLAKNIVLVIENFHNFIGGPARPGAIDISGTLLGYLQNPRFRVVAVTDFVGFHRFIEPNPIASLFEKVEVSEVSQADTIRLLELFVPVWEAKYKKFISYPALRELVLKTDRYLPSLPFPKKATDLMAELLVSLSRRPDPVVLPEHVNQIVSEKSQVPIGQISIKEKEVLLNLEGLLHQNIINQEEAVKEVSSALRRARSGITIKKGPMGAFLFLGPTGVGKTETAKALAKLYFGGEERIIRLDLSEFQNPSDLKRLIGSEGEESFFVISVRENPFSLVLLDEIEKAHPNILNLFLQVLDEGSMRDGLGRKVNFLNTIIIATSNAGYQVILEAIEQKLEMPAIKEKLLSHIFGQAIFRPEFINRFDAVIVFRSLTKENLLGIAGLLLKKLKNNLADKGIDLEISDDLRARVVELGYDPVFGARQMRRVIQDRVENVIASSLLSEQIKRGDKISIETPDFNIKKL